MDIDIFTLMTVGCSVIFVLSLITLLYWSWNRDAAWLGWWSLAFGVLAAGNLFLLLRPTDPLASSGGIGTALTIAGLGFVWHACRVFERRRQLLWTVATVCGTWMALFLMPGFYENLVARVVAASIPFSGFLMLAAFELWRGRREHLTSRLPAAAILFTLGLVMAARIPLAAVAPFPMGSGPIDGGVVAAFNGTMFISAIALTVLLVSMTLERSEHGHRVMAHTDPLTGLPNRRALQREYGAEVAADTAVVVFDLDHFKLINDRFGHSAGDRILKQFTQICRENVRQVDLAVRLGGEEFAVIMPRTPKEAAVQVAERIRRLFSETVVEIEGGAAACTVSAGVAVANGLMGMDDLMHLADAELYRAKRAGRNRVLAQGISQAA